METVQDTAYTFTADEFGFADADAADTLASVKIATLPAVGALALDGTAVMADEVISKVDIDEGDLTFTPVPGATGDAHANFTFKVNDGRDDSANAYTMTINVTAVSCGMPSFGDRRNRWSGTVTVGTVTSGSSTLGHGFNSDTSQGELAATGFVIGRNDYTVDAALVYSGSANAGDLAFSLTGDHDNNLTTAEKAALRLHVCDSTAIYDFSTADLSTGTAGYTWAESLDWSSETTRTLYLSLPANTAATGAPAITGTARSGQDLAVDLTGIVDADGLTGDLSIQADNANPSGVEYTYRWLRVDPDGVSNEARIASADAATYTLTDADLGKKVKVRVSFTDDLSSSEMFTSEAYPSSSTVTGAGANTAPTADDNTVTTGEDRAYTFTADDFGFADTDTGNTLASVKIVTVPAAGTLALDGTAVLADGVVTTAQIDADMLIFRPARDAHGDPYTTFTFKVNDGTDDSASAYTMTIDVTDAPAPVCGVPDFGTRRNFWTGTAEVDGFTFLAKTFYGYTAGYPTLLMPAGELDDRTFTIGSNDYTVNGTYVQFTGSFAGSLYFEVPAGQALTNRESAALRLHVCDMPYDFSSATNTLNTSTWTGSLDWSAPVVTRTLYLSLPANNDATGEPAITGTAQVGQELAADASPIMDTDGVPSSLTYQWVRVDADGTSNPVDITDANAATYTLTDDDLGKTIKVKVSFTDELSGVEMFTSEAYPSSSTVTGADTAPVIELSPSAAGEGDAVTFTVTLAPAATQEVTVNYATSVAAGDTAAQTDFAAGSGTLTFAVGDTQQTFVVSTLDDSIDESDETFTVTLDNVSPAGAATLPADPTATGTITDDDEAPVLVLSVAPETIAEAGGGTSTVTVGTGTGSTFATAQTIALTLSGTATETEDYDISSKSLTLPAGVGSGASSVTATVTAVDDNFYDGRDDDETIVIAGSREGTAFGAQQTISILDDEDAPEFTLILTPASISENGGTSIVTGTLDTPIAEALTGMLETFLDPNADPPVVVDDYVISGSLTFAAQSTQSTGTLTVTAVDNRADTADKLLDLEWIPDLGYVKPGEAHLIIEDDDAAPVLELSVNPETIAEAGGTSTVTVSTGTGSTFATAQTIALALSGTATEMADYSITSKSLTLPAGAGSGASSVTATVTAMDDALSEGDETVLIDAALGTGGMAPAVGTSQTLTIIDDDVDEPPSAPATPMVSAVSGSTTSLSVSWAAPANAGKPAIASYDVQYRVGSSGAWSDGPQDVTDTSTTITSLVADTLYEARVRATNAEGDSGWSDPPGSGRTNAASNNAPVFSSSSVSREIAENTAAGVDVGAAVTATDADAGDTLGYTLGGADVASFDFVETTGQIRTKAGVSYDHEAKASYTVTVTASDNSNATAVADVTISITDVDEPPSAPATPMVSAVSGSTTSLSVSWAAPANAGKPAIASYDVQYRVGSSGTWSDGPVDVAGTSTTIASLVADTLYEARVRASNAEGDSGWSDPPGSGRTNAPGNNAPVFSPAMPEREITENTAAGVDVGAAVTATDADAGDTLGYTLGGADVAAFDFVETTGQIRTKAGVSYDHEAKSSYTVTVTASDGTATADASVTISVTDVDEPPSAPATPMVSAVSGSTTSLSVSWAAPANAGKPAIASYDVQYRVGSSGAWSDGPQDVTDTSTTITSLVADTLYEARVRASNAEGDSGWSDPPGSGRTNAPGNNAPVFSPAMPEREITENTAAGVNVGAAVTATDADAGDTLGYTLGGADVAAFDFVETTGQIRTKAGVSYDHEAKSSYTVTVTASDGTATADASVTISVTDVDEPPSAPATPMVSAVSGSTTSLSVSWAAPANAGKPAIASYDVQYRVGSSGTWSDGPVDVAGTSTTIASLVANTLYEARVRATNAEGDSGWSDPPGSGRTNAPSNNAPVFSSSSVSREIAENTAAGVDVGAAVTATDADAGDTLSYTLGGADVASFDFVETTGQIRTKAGVSYDHEAKASYTVTVTASDDNSNATAVADVTISITDVDEPPSAPATPMVSAVSGSTTSLSVSWAAPANAGKPAIASYDVQYRVGSSGTWSDGPVDVAGTSTTIASLVADTLYEARVRASNAEGDSGWSDPPGSGRTNAPGNNAPVFSPAMPEREITENTAAGVNVGAAVTATDADAGDTLGYTLGGADVAAFDFVETTGQIRTKAGVSYDHEAKSSYTVTVTASDGTATAVADVTISVTDVDEPPSAPATPMVSAVSGSTTSLSVSWAAPANAGKPAIASYDVQYRVGSSGTWSDGPVDVAGTSTTIASLVADTLYEARVRASNAEGDSGWSDPPGSGRTNAPSNNAPVFSSSSVSREIAENTAAGQDVGAAVTATDADAGDTLSYTLGGADVAAFDFVETTGQIRTKAGVSYDHEAKASYTVTVTATDNSNATAVADVTISITDVDEPPSAPATPMVSAVSGSTTSLSVSWAAPANAGKPAIASYDVQYRVGSSGTWSDGPVDVAGTSTTIASLVADTLYEARVRASNAEGDSGWSDPPGSGRTNAPSNNAPVFSPATCPAKSRRTPPRARTSAPR